MFEKTPPIFLIAGGRGSIKRRAHDPLIEEAVSLSGRPLPRVAYVGAASGDNAAFRVLIAGFLKKAGAGEIVPVPLCGKRADPDAARKVLRDCDLVFVSGGDVEEGMQVLRQTRMTRYFHALHRAGKPFFGISAGSIMLASQWIRWRDPNEDASAELFPCLGFAPLLCDTHGEGDQWEELRALLKLSPAGSVGYGIASGTALVVHADGKVSARGEVHRFRRKSDDVVQVESLT